VWHKVHSAFQREYGDVEAIRLRRKLEVRMHVDPPDSEGVGRQGLHGRVDHVIAQRDVHLARSGPGHTMTGGDHVEQAGANANAMRIN